MPLATSTAGIKSGGGDAWCVDSIKYNGRSFDLCGGQGVWLDEDCGRLAPGFDGGTTRCVSELVLDIVIRILCTHGTRE